MTLYGGWSRWAAALAVGLMGVGAATVVAAPDAGTAASAFTLTLEGKLAGAPGAITSQGTFTSQAPFCTTGRFVDEGPMRPHRGKRRFSCDDGTGGLTVSIARWEYYGPPFDTTWQILDGSGSYAGLRGRGAVRGEMLTHEGFANWRSTFEGDVDRDAVAPTIAISKATVTKLPQPGGAYSLELALELRDNVTDNAVSYFFRASAGGVELARRLRAATRGRVSITLRIRPPAGARTVQLQLTGEDPIGNAASVRRVLKLHR